MRSSEEGGILPPDCLFFFFFSFSRVFVLVVFFVYLYFCFLAALGLHCCTWAFSHCSKRGLLFVAVCGLLVAVASPVVEHWL